MSRKRKRYRSKNGTKRTVPTGPVPTGPQSNLPALLSAFDGYSNAAAFLGEDSPLLSSIDKGIPPPNSPITLSGGWMRNPVSKKPVKVKEKSGTTPLVDTGQLYNDFDFEITGK